MLPIISIEELLRRSEGGCCEEFFVGEAGPMPEGFDPKELITVIGGTDEQPALGICFAAVIEGKDNKAAILAATTENPVKVILTAAPEGTHGFPIIAIP